MVICGPFDDKDPKQFVRAFDDRLADFAGQLRLAGQNSVLCKKPLQPGVTERYVVDYEGDVLGQHLSGDTAPAQAADLQ